MKAIAVVPHVKLANTIINYVGKIYDFKIALLKIIVFQFIRLHFRWSRKHGLKLVANSPIIDVYILHYLTAIYIFYTGLKDMKTIYACVWVCVCVHVFVCRRQNQRSY